MHRSLLAALALALLLAVGPPVPAAAAGDTPTSSTSTYEVVPEKGQVRVTVTQKVTNRIPNASSSYDCSRSYYDYWTGWVFVPKTCTTTTRYYVNEAMLRVEASAKNLKVTSNGGSVKLSRASSTDALRSYKLTFPRIFNGQTRTITATYVIPGGAPRSATSNRVNGAYVHFWAMSQATDSAKVRIVLPKAFDVETFGGTVKESTEGSRRILSSGAITDPASYFVGVTGVNHAGFMEEKITTSGGRTVSLLGWPGDDEWMSAVRGEAVASIPMLEALIGQPLPGDGVIQIRQTAGRELGGTYIGTFDSQEQVARVSENYGRPGIVTHELAHAWFNLDLFDSAWMAEGYAGWIESASGAVSTPCQAPARYPGNGRPNLGEWHLAGPRATAVELDVVGYQYAAACSIITSVADQIGEARMREIIGVLATNESAYLGVPDATSETRVGWREWLDAVDERGMGPAGLDDSEAVASVLVQYGIASFADLEGRADARAALARLRNSSEDWAVPTAVTRPMAAWSFGSAQSALDAATEALGAVMEVESLLPSIDASTNPIRSEYEEATSASDLARVREKALDQLAAAAVVAGAVAASSVERGPIERVGLIGTDLAAMTALAVGSVAALDSATAMSLARQVTEIADGAMTAGLIRIGLILAAVMAVALAAWFVRRRGSVRSDEIEFRGGDSEPGHATSVEDELDGAITSVGNGAFASEFQATHQDREG